MKHCIRCGADNDDSARYCTNCGAPLSLSSASDEQTCPGYSDIGQKTSGTYTSFEAQIPTYYRSFQSAVHTCLVEKYATFYGRATRSEYWLFALFNFLVSFGFVFLALIFYSEPVIMGLIVLYLLYLVAVFIPGLAVSVRRLHDKGNSGWLLLLYFFPYLGSIILFVLFLLDSEPFDNEYGLAPREEY